MGRFLLIIGALFFIMAADKAGASDPENQIFLDLKDGRVVIDLLPDVAPKHVERIKELSFENLNLLNKSLADIDIHNSITGTKES